MKNHFLGNLSRFHLWIDIFLLNASYILGGSILFENFITFQDHHFINLLLITNLLWIVCFYLFNLYNFTAASYNSLGHFGKLLLTYDAHLILMEGFLYLTGDINGFKEHLVFLTFEIFVFSAIVIHVVITFLLGYFRRSVRTHNRYAVIGNDDSYQWINRFQGNQQEVGYHFCGILKLEDDQHQLEHLENFMEQERLDFLYCSLSEMSHEQLSKVLKLAERKKTQIRLIPDFHGFQLKHVNFSPQESYPAFHIGPKPLSNVNQRLVKRAFDVVFSSIFIIIGLPVFLLLVVIVKLSSRGPVFIKQERTGRWGKTFNIIRFQTLHPGRYHESGHELDASGVRAAVGSFLKRSRLDDMPQFFNVLKGEMSIVGPQPLRQSEADMLMDASHDFQKVLTVKPGLTSIGQIKVGYATSLNESLHRLKYDMLYLNTYSWTKDLYLIFLTFQVLLLGKSK